MDKKRLDYYKKKLVTRREELVRGMFGDVPRLARLATWMQSVAGGSPLHCMELARHLVERKVIRYEGGLWSVPDDLKLEGMPKRLAEAMEKGARELGLGTEHEGILPLHTAAAPGTWSACQPASASRF